MSDTYKPLEAAVLKAKDEVKGAIKDAPDRLKGHLENCYSSLSEAATRLSICAIVSGEEKRTNNED